LRQKYASDVPFSDAGSSGSETSASAAASAAAYQPIEWGGKIVEEVGFEKVRRRQAMLPELRIVLLDGCRVAGLTNNARALSDDSDASMRRRTAAMQEIARVCPNVVELDLSRNLIERWEDVVAICAQLKALRSLRVKYGFCIPIVYGCFCGVDVRSIIANRHGLYCEVVATAF
jgi:hypothetical protein